MKKYLKHILLFIPILAIFSCAEKLEPYNDSTNRLNFIFKDNNNYSDSIVRFTFVYNPIGVESDTVWFPIRTMGYITDKDRKVSLRQVETENMAQAGVHFYPLDDPQITSKYYLIRAGKSEAQIPIVLKRDPSLKQSEYTLKVEISDNDNFKAGIARYSYKYLTIADMLVQPANWNGQVVYNFAGPYGKVKHQFMIDAVRSKGMVINDEWIKEIIPSPNSIDMGLTAYWAGFFTDELVKENRRRQALGLGVIREDPTESQTEGNIVRFRLKGKDLSYI